MVITVYLLQKISIPLKRNWNYLLTNPGERVANPLFGAGLRQFIFKFNYQIKHLKFENELKQINKKTIVIDLTEYFNEEFFETKKIVQIPI